MAKTLSLEALLAALNKQEARKNVKLVIEAKALGIDQYDLQIKSIEVDKKLLNELGIEPKVKEKGDIVKQPSKIDKLTEIVLKGFEQVDKRLDNLERRMVKVELSLGRIESLPIIQKALKEQKAKEKSRSK